MKFLKRIKKLNKTEKIALATTAGFFLLGVAALIIGFGLKDGWDKVLGWFASRWAIYVYIAIAILIFVLAFVIHKERMEK